MRSAIAWIFRVFSYFYHLGVAVFLLALGLVALLSGDDHTLTFTLLPWEGDNLTYALLCLGLLGVIAAVLAMLGKLRILFVITALVFFALLLRGLYFSPYRFDSGLLSWRAANYLALAGLIAVVGAFMKQRPDRRRG